jgi:hypothetical protein
MQKDNCSTVGGAGFGIAGTRQASIDLLDASCQKF